MDNIIRIHAITEILGLLAIDKIIIGKIIKTKENNKIKIFNELTLNNMIKFEKKRDTKTITVPIIIKIRVFFVILSLNVISFSIMERIITKNPTNAIASGKYIIIAILRSKRKRII